MREEIRPLDEAEMRALNHVAATILGLDSSGILFKLDDGRVILAFSCLVCGGPEAHLNLAEVDPQFAVDNLPPAGPDIETS